jgi:predicted ArsR family transcriptional regulator
MLMAGNIQSVNRFPVFKALGDNTRYAIYLELARSPVPLSTADIAEALDLHPNTVRPHLERMREIGLLEVDSGSRGAVGRPQHRYSLSADAPSLGLEPSAFRLLARLVAGAAASARLASDQVADVGRAHGRTLAEDRGDSTPSRAAALTDARSRTEPAVPVSAEPVQRCVAALVGALAELGFDPALGDDGELSTIAFTHCPFREVAEAFPEIVCHLHRGIVEGYVDAVGGAQVTRFATLADRNPCQMDLVGR